MATLAIFIHFWLEIMVIISASHFVYFVQISITLLFFQSVEEEERRKRPGKNPAHKRRGDAII